MEKTNEAEKSIGTWNMKKWKTLKFEIGHMLTATSVEFLAGITLLSSWSLVV